MLDHIAASLIDRVSNIGIKLVGCPFDVLKVLRPSQTLAALVAVIAPHVIFRPAASTPRSHLAAGHRYKRTIRAFDDLQIPYHESLVQGDRTESPEAILREVHELDSNLSYIHLDASLSPLNRRSGSRMGDDRYLLFHSRAGPRGKRISSKLSFPLQIRRQGFGLGSLGA
jgi:hypothetical protein